MSAAACYLAWRRLAARLCVMLLVYTLSSSAAPAAGQPFADTSDRLPNIEPARTQPAAVLACGTLDGISIDPMEAVGDWHVLKGNGALTGALATVSGYHGHAVQLNYDLGTQPGAWVQLRRDFNPPLDLSAGDHLRFFHHGTLTNTLEVGLVSANDQNYFGSSWNQATQVPWWTYATWDFQDFHNGQGEQFPDFHQVKAIFISVVNSAGGVGGTGSFSVDELQYLDIAARAVPAAADHLTADQTIAQRAANWIESRQQPGGLLKSWQEESVDYAWLYDQALGLIVLSETDLPKAHQLAGKLHTLRNGDGSWYLGYHYSTSAWVEQKKDVGPIAWTVYALMQYYLRGGTTTSYQDALAGAHWLATQQQADGSMSPITEWNLDTWWAFQSVGYRMQANRLRDFLLTQVWDDAMGRFKSSPSTYQIFLDNQTWGAAFLRAVGREQDARRALSYARWTLAAASSTGQICGFDGAGPFSIWNEGALQYIAQGGENSQYYWGQLAGQQAQDGGLPNSFDRFQGYIVWLSPWHGVAPTAWLYFAATGGPFRPMRWEYLPLTLK